MDGWTEQMDGLLNRWVDEHSWRGGDRRLTHEEGFLSTTMA